MRLSLTDVLFKAYWFITGNPFGPRGEFGSFRPLKVEFDEGKSRWVVVCVFRRGGKEIRARITIDDAEGEIIGYEELEG